MKDSRRIMELAKLCSEVSPGIYPNLPYLIREQSALPTQTFWPSCGTTDAVPAATAVAAPVRTCAHGRRATSPQLHPRTSQPPVCNSARRLAAARKPHLPPPMPPVSANLPQVRDVAAMQPGVHGLKLLFSFSPDYDLIASSLSNSHYRTWPKRDTKKPGKQGDIESSFLPSSYAILLRMATTNWLPTVTVHSVSKKMAVLLFKIRNNIPFNLGELIFDHIMAFRHGQGKEDKVLLPFSSLIYGILCKQGFQKHPQEEELSPTSVYSIDRRLLFKSHFDDCSTFKSAVVPEGEYVSSTRSRVSVDFAAVSARVLTTQSILKSLKSTVVHMEKVLLEDQMLLQSFETDEMDLDSASAR
nr:uncharacterized protein LOC109185001 [Ipomoea batatas]